RLNFVLKDLVPRNEIVSNLVPILSQFKRDRLAGESFGDYCQRLGAGTLQAMLPGTAVNKETPTASPGRLQAILAANGANGVNGHGTSPKTLPLDLAPAAEPQPCSNLPRKSEQFLAGPAGEERLDYSYCFNSEGTVLRTIVYFYGGDQRAAAAHSGL